MLLSPWSELHDPPKSQRAKLAAIARAGDADFLRRVLEFGEDVRQVRLAAQLRLDKLDKVGQASRLPHERSEQSEKQKERPQTQAPLSP